MARNCPNCGLRASDKAKYCRKCGTALNVNNVPVDYSVKPQPLAGRVWDAGKNRLGLSGLKSILLDMRKGFRRGVHLTPVFILFFLWLVVSMVISFGYNGLFWKIISFLLFSQGGMQGGISGLLGGIAGKMLYAYFVIMLLAPLYSIQKPFFGVKEGAKKFASVIFQVKTINDILNPLLGIGAAFILHNAVTGDNRWSNIFPSVIAALIVLRSLGRRSGTVWDIAVTISGSRSSSHSIDKLLSGLIAGLVIASAAFIYNTPFIGYVAGSLIILFVILVKTGIRVFSTSGNMQKIVFVLFCLLLASAPLIISALTENQIKGVWKRDSISIVNPHKSSKGNEVLQVNDQAIHYFYNIDSKYDIQYSWEAPPKKLYAGGETGLVLRQYMDFKGEQPATQPYLTSSMYIIYSDINKVPDIVELFPANRDFSTELSSQEQKSEHMVFFTRMPDYHELYEKLNKRNSKLVITVQASFGGRVEYKYNLSRTPWDSISSLMFGIGFYNNSAKPAAALLVNIASFVFVLFSTAVSVGALTLIKRKRVVATSTEQAKKEELAVADSHDLIHLYDDMSKAAEAGWPKYKDVLQRHLSKSKEHNIQSKHANAVGGAVYRFNNSISGMADNLAALGYDNDAPALLKRGNDITDISGKIVYSNYIFNSLASNNRYTAFMEMSNVFALQDMKTGIMAGPSANWESLIQMSMESHTNSQTAFRNAVLGRYGENIKNMTKERILTAESLEEFKTTRPSYQKTDELYRRIISQKPDSADYRDINKFTLYCSKGAVKQFQSHNSRKENTSIVVASMVEE